jgi:hypothetical protein
MRIHPTGFASLRSARLRVMRKPLAATLHNNHLGVSMSFNVGHWLISNELEQMGRYLDLLHSAINENHKQFVASIEQITSTMSEDEVENFYAFNEDDFIEVSADFPRLLFSSFVVSWYSFVEIHLMNFCKYRNLKISISIQDNENYGEGIRRAYNFLNRAAGYQIDNVHWQELTRIGKTRNKIVHNNGRLPFSPYASSSNSVPVKVHEDITYYLQIDQDLYGYLQTHNLLKFTGLFYIAPNFEYCKHLVQFGLSFFEKLYKDFGQDKQGQ